MNTSCATVFLRIWPCTERILTLLFPWKQGQYGRSGINVFFSVLAALIAGCSLGLCGLLADAAKASVGDWTVSNVPLPIRIQVGAIALEAELKPTRTAKAIYDLLPLEAKINVWGEEFYFKIPVIKDHRETATLKVEVGDIAYWGNGHSVAIFFGRTPVSPGADPVPADRVNIIGKIKGDATLLRTAMEATLIRMEKI
jgi:uncharacterized protein